MSGDGIVTLLFTELVDAPVLLERLGSQTFPELRRTQLQLLREAVSTNGGHEVKTARSELDLVEFLLAEEEPPAGKPAA